MGQTFAQELFNCVQLFFFEHRPVPSPFPLPFSKKPQTQRFGVEWRPNLFNLSEANSSSEISNFPPEIKIERQKRRRKPPHTVSVSLFPACSGKIRSGLVGSYLSYLGSSIEAVGKCRGRIQDKRDEMSGDL